MTLQRVFLLANVSPFAFLPEAFQNGDAGCYGEDKIFWQPYLLIFRNNIL